MYAKGSLFISFFSPWRSPNPFSSCREEEGGGPYRGSGLFLFPERFVQFAAPPHLVHVRGNHRGVGILPCAGPSLCALPRSYTLGWRRLSRRPSSFYSFLYIHIKTTMILCWRPSSPKLPMVADRDMGLF